MKLAVGADHGGFARKGPLVRWLKKEGHAVTDVGTHGEEPVDYPDFAAQVARRVARGACARGILLCGTGIGMAIAANKVPGVRAAVAWSVETARLAAEHNKANVLCLGGRQFNSRQIQAMVKAWLSTPFGGGRHERRVKKIMALEKSC